ncbi:MAG: sialidase family protein [Halobacteriaceae archaeon]
MQVRQFTVSRDDYVYESFPDVARAGGDRLVCVFSRCTHHGDRAFTRNVYVTSDDRGRTWSEPRPLTDPLYQERGDDPFWDCPRVSRLADGRLVAAVNRIAGDTPDREEERTWLLESEDGGETWGDPRATPARGIVPDQVVELDAGRWLLTVHTVTEVSGEERWRVQTWLSDDEGATWEGPHVVAEEPDYMLCEGSVVELPGGDLACLMRENSGRGLDAFVAVSEDGGETWGEPFRVPIPACHRPVAGVLQSGRVLVTHRHMQGGAGWLGSWTQNTFAALTDADSLTAGAREEASARIVPLDYDRSAAADTGYTGWVQFDDGEVYVVNYVVDDAPARPVREPSGYGGDYDEVPKAYVRGYAFHERDLVVDP